MLNSLRFRLFAIILGPLLLIALGIGIWRLASAQQTAQEVFDRNLLVTALAVSRDVASRDGDAISVETAQLLSRSAGEPVRYHVYAPDGVFVTGFASPPVPIDFEWDRSQTFAYFDAVSRGRDVRVLRLQYVTQIAGFSEPEANRFFGKPDPATIDGLHIHLRPPTETRAAYTARHEELLAEMG